MLDQSCDRARRVLTPAARALATARSTSTIHPAVMDIQQRSSGSTRGPAHYMKENSTTYIVKRDGKILYLPEHRRISDNEVNLGHIGTLRQNSPTFEY